MRISDWSSDVCSSDLNASANDNPSARAGEELTVEFTVLGQSFVGLNGGPHFKPNEAVSFMILTDDQEQTDRYWNAIVGNGGQESMCGWCKDRRSEEHTSELQSLMRNSSAVFCLKKKKQHTLDKIITTHA